MLVSGGGRLARLSSTARCNSTAVPVCIVGGGPVGLYAATLLNQHGIQSIVIERAAQTPAYNHPRAHVLNTRTMELMRELGLDAQIHATAPPREQWRHFRYCESITGRDLGDLGAVDHFAGETARNLEAASPVGISHLSQPRLEEILHSSLLRDQQQADGGASILYGHQVVNVTQDNDSVTVDAVSQTGEDSQLVCDYLIAADGATANVREQCGIGISGQMNLQHFMSVHFTCPDVAELVLPRPGMLYFVFNHDVIAVLVAHNIEEGVWNLQLPYYPPHQKASDFDKTVLEGVLSSCFGVKLGGDGVPWKLHSANPWRMNAAVAHQFSCGRIHFAGDSAHQFPPSGGFGLNTGLQDVHNLCWKLAAVHRGDAHSDLLNSYHVERYQVAQENAELSVSNWRRGLLVPKALGLDAANLDTITSALDVVSWALPAGTSKAIVDSSLHIGRSTLSLVQPSDNPLSSIYSHARLSALREVLKSRAELPMLFPGNDLGFVYQSNKAALMQNSRRPKRPVVREGVKQYQPWAEAGARVPHGWLQLSSGGPVSSTLDLVKQDGQCVLFVSCQDTSGHAWEKATASLATEIKVVLVTEGKDEQQRMECTLESTVVAHDASLDWTSMCELADGDAVLVRPDGHIAWRYRANSSEVVTPALHLSGLLSDVIARLHM